MSDDSDNSRINRRNVIKAISGAGVAASLSGTVQALSGSEKAESVDAATSTDSFEAFESAFGREDIDVTGSSVTRRDDGDAELNRIELETNLGKMGVILVDDGETTFDITLLDLSEAVEDRLPAAYADVPEGTRPLLFATGDGDGLEFRRDATEREKVALARKTGVPASQIEATLESERGGFVVAGSEMGDDEYLVVELDEFVFHEVSPSVIADAAAVESDPVTPDLSWWCRYRCGNCLAKAAKCAGCCVATSLGCIACIIWQCGLGASSCYDCYDCLQ